MRHKEMLRHPGYLAGPSREGGIIPFSFWQRRNKSSGRAEGRGDDGPLRGEPKAEAGGRTEPREGNAGDRPANEGDPSGGSSGLLPTPPAETPLSTPVDVNGPFLRFAAQCVVAVLALGFVDAG